jgi:hypothetical protein
MRVLLYVDHNDQVLGTLTVVNGQAQGTGIGTREDTAIVDPYAPRKPPITPADGNQYLAAVRARMRTAYVRGVWQDAPVQKGGPGSGFRGHEGRPGQRGGSTPGGAGAPNAAGGGTGTAQEGENPYGTTIPETEDQVVLYAKGHHLEPLLEQVEKAEVTEEAVPEQLDAPDLRQNALRIIAYGRRQFAIEPIDEVFAETPEQTSEAFLKATAEHEAELRDMPLIHGTTPDAAANAWKDGLLSNRAYIAKAKADLEAAYARPMSPAQEKEYDNLVREAGYTGSTFDVDRNAGLDNFAFLSHGVLRNGYEKGVIILIEQADG